MFLQARSEPIYAHAAGMTQLFSTLVVLICHLRGACGNLCKSLFPAEIPHPCSSKGCASCPVGYGVAHYCNGDTLTVCRQCVQGLEYSDQDNPYDVCSPVSFCGDNMVVEHPATAEHDVVCKCVDGYKADDLGICVPYSRPTTSETTVDWTTATETTMSFSTMPNTTAASKSASKAMRLSSTKIVAAVSQTALPHSTDSSDGVSDLTASWIKTSSLDVSSNPVSRDLASSQSMEVSSHFTKLSVSSSLWGTLLSTKVPTGTTSLSKSSHVSLHTLIVVSSVCAVVVTITWATVLMVVCYTKRRRRQSAIDETQSLPLMSSESQDSLEYSEDTHFVIGDEGAQAFVLPCPLRRWYLVPPWTHYHWTFNDKPISPAEPIKQKRSQLAFSVLTSKNAGLYCYQAGAKEAQVHLLIKRDLKPVVSVDGVGSVELSFIMWGSDEPWDHQWYKNGVLMSHRPREYVGERSSTLRIITADELMTGRYHCVATCRLARVRSRTTSLNVVGVDRDETGVAGPIGGRDLSRGLYNSCEAEESKVTVSDQTTVTTTVHQWSQPDDDACKDGVVAMEMIDDYVSETARSRPLVAQVTGHSELLATAFQYMYDLSSRMLHQLGVKLGRSGHHSHEDMVDIAKALHINPNRLRTSSTAASRGVALLEELRDANPYYPLAQLCRIFARYDRLDCVSELQSLIKEAGGRLPLPQGLTSVHGQVSDIIVGMEMGDVESH